MDESKIILLFQRSVQKLFANSGVHSIFLHVSKTVQTKLHVYFLTTGNACGAPSILTRLLDIRQNFTAFEYLYV